MNIFYTLSSVALSAGQKLMRIQFEGSDGADLLSQSFFAELLHRVFPRVPLLFEESDVAWKNDTMSRFPDMRLLDGSDSNMTLPEEFIVVDPLDGSVVFENGCLEWAVSVAYVKDGQPNVSCVYQPLQEMLIATQRGEGCFCREKPLAMVQKTKPFAKAMIGLDMCQAVSSDDMANVFLPLVNAFRYPRNLPSVASGIDLLLGRTVAWCSTNARIWDVAGTALAVQEAGGIAECLDGSPIPWNYVRMPPLLFCANQAVCLEVRKLLRLRPC